MMNSEPTSTQNFRHTDKWLTLDVMQRVEQVRCIAEMLEATMEDICEHMENLESAMGCLQEGTDTIEDQIEDMMSRIEEEIHKREDDLPF
ncbi:MAG: hypothetical protein IJ088_13845 [Clostridia bacterium]|nr:hypothetical protein [Clostridia bacterium]